MQHTIHRTMLRCALVCTLGMSSLTLPWHSLAATPAVTAGGVLGYTNAERYRAGLPLLASNAILSQVATAKMQDLFVRQYFAHEAPTGEDVSDLATRAGYTYVLVGENLALGSFTSNAAVVTAWMNSPGHRKNILSPGFTEIGIAAGRGTYQGRDAWIIVQSFGTPRSYCPAVSNADATAMRESERTLTLMRVILTTREALLEDRSVPRSTYLARIRSYNLAAERFNEQVAQHHTLVAAYNTSVERFNSCLTRVASST